MKKFFQFEELNTNFRQEIIAGFTTFITMAYIIVVNPKILEVAGIPFQEFISNQQLEFNLVVNQVLLR